MIADGLAELQIRWPNVALVFCETRPLAEEFTYRYLAAAHTWAEGETAALTRLTPPGAAPSTATAPSTTTVRAWATAHGIAVADRGRLRPEIWEAWATAHP